MSQPKPNIVLIGFKAAGKSTIAKALLNTKLKLKLFGLDDAIEAEAKTNLQSFVKKNSWKAFRALESKHCQRTKNLQGYVIDCGGGVVEQPNNLKTLRKHGVVFWVDTTESVLLDRLEGDSFLPDSPSSPKPNDLRSAWKTLYERRLPLYKKHSDCTITTDNKSPDECAMEIFLAYAALQHALQQDGRKGKPTA